MQNKHTKLTGELLFQVEQELSFDQPVHWSDLPKSTRDDYDERATLLRYKLSLCDSCGKRAPLLEVTDLWLCEQCVAPPDDAIAAYTLIEADNSTVVPGHELIKQATATLAQLGWKEIDPSFLKRWSVWKVFQSPSGCPHPCCNIQELCDLIAFAQSQAKRPDCEINALNEVATFDKRTEF